jgi:hypothetical protein
MTTPRKPQLLVAALTMAVVGLWASPAFAATVGPYVPEVGLSAKKTVAVIVAVVAVVIVVAVGFWLVRRNRTA